MDRTRKFAALANLAAAVWALLCVGFILLDTTVLQWTTRQLEGAEGLGVGIVLVHHAHGGADLPTPALLNQAMRHSSPDRNAVSHRAFDWRFGQSPVGGIAGTPEPFAGAGKRIRRNSGRKYGLFWWSVLKNRLFSKIVGRGLHGGFSGALQQNGWKRTVRGHRFG